jgi:hypothetical protein
MVETKLLAGLWWDRKSLLASKAIAVRFIDEYILLIA